MINIKVDEAYAFDYLSILEIKKNLNNLCKKNWEDCFIFLQDQISDNKMQEIINSSEYKSMVETNKLTFDAVEKARYGNISAKEVDDVNMLRYKKKLKLQTKFFNINLMEYKT